MSLQIQSWESTLLTRAHEALKGHMPESTYVRQADDHTLQMAYEHCNHITRHHSKTFFLASSLLPPDKRRAARALYAFCRITDDIADADQPAEERGERLESWRALVMNTYTNPLTDNPVALAWTDAQHRYNIPQGYAEQLIDGVARDLIQTRYQTFEDLAGYSYGVASTVGLMAMHIIGYESKVAVPYAVRLGVALQLTNILRDVNEDWQSGRVYLPQDELDAFGLSEADIAAGNTDERWQKFMTFQIERTHRLYDESWAGIYMLHADGRFAIAAAAELYRAILDDIQDNNSDVFSRRAHVGTWGKLRRLPSIWWRSKMNSAS